MPARIQWSRISDEDLLKFRLCDLPIKFEGTPLKRQIKQLYKELGSRGIRFRPHVWLSDEFFTPDQVPGFAVPFYLAHPRLMKLERKQMLQIEGGSEQDFMRIIRHEAGHALDHAYRLHSDSGFRRVFGSLRKPYPESYRPNPNSRSYVLHLGSWYAQSHPLEDYAETFAVWLGPRWRSRYQGWPALRKLVYIDQLIKNISGKPSKNWRREKVDTLRQIKMTLGEYYSQKKEQYAIEYPAYYDRDLRRIFSQEKRYTSRQTAVSFLRDYRTEVRHLVAEGTGVHSYSVDHVLETMIDRAKDLRLRVCFPKNQTRRQVLIMLTVHTMNIVHSGRYRFYYGL
ncbi:putative zinc-binding metallopeptidase [bacterium]|nr:putative zinc-binding metallopeptidase [bacterium]